MPLSMVTRAYTADYRESTHHPGNQTAEMAARCSSPNRIAVNASVQISHPTVHSDNTFAVADLLAA